MTGQVTVVVATLNRAQFACDVVNEILRQDYPEYEIIVVDQSESESLELREIERRASGRLKVIRLQEANLPKARNVGLLASAGEFICYLDDDVRVPSSFLSGIVGGFCDERTVGVTSLTLQGEEDTVERALERTISQHEGEAGIGRGAPGRVTWMPGCNMTFRRSVILGVGGFDGNFSGGGVCEDVDACIRVRAPQQDLLCIPTVVMQHLALNRGGCEVRNEQRIGERAVEKYHHSVYCWLKNWRKLGVALALRNVARATWAYVRGGSAPATAVERLKRLAVCVMVMLRVIGQRRAMIPAASSHVVEG